MNRVAVLVSERQAVCGKCKADLDTSGTAAYVDLASRFAPNGPMRGSEIHDPV